MTPLAQKILNELTLPKRDRTFADNFGLLARMPDIHCFEMTEVDPWMRDLAKKFIGVGGPDSRLGFLPAPATWIEWVEGDKRVGCLLLEDPDDLGAHVYATEGRAFVEVGGMAMKETLADTVEDRAKPFMWTATAPENEQQVRNFRALMMVLYAALAMINTPKSIGRRQHTPHAGLQRKLAHARGAVGKYPLNAWTEILLQVRAPKVDSGGTGETILTGRKCLHWVMQFSRIRLGRVEWVTSHYRGDPALGMKQSRYRVVPPLDGSPPEIHP